MSPLNERMEMRELVASESEQPWNCKGPDEDGVFTLFRKPGFPRKPSIIA